MPIAAPVGDLSNPSADEQEALAALNHYQLWEAGYSKQQSTRPQTLGYGLADSPAGQLAWIVEKLYAWSDCDGHPENVFSRDEMLDDVMLYWATNSAASSARLYWESFGVFGGAKVEVPTGVARFPKEIFRPPRSWCESVYNITHWTDMPRGGHFAAYEQPELFVDDVRAFFSTLAR
jgi:pimeloyl-ACP methyl ester carboxylesterase